LTALGHPNHDDDRNNNNIRLLLLQSNATTEPTAVTQDMKWNEMKIQWFNTNWAVVEFHLVTPSVRRSSIGRSTARWMACTPWRLTLHHRLSHQLHRASVCPIFGHWPPTMSSPLSANYQTSIQRATQFQPTSWRTMFTSWRHFSSRCLTAVSR